MLWEIYGHRLNAVILMKNQLKSNCASWFFSECEKIFLGRTLSNGKGFTKKKDYLVVNT
jgi:hypothetical protein